MGITSPGAAASVPMGPMEGAACAVHPESPAAAICARCGAFTCSVCMAFVEGKLYCEACRARGDVDYTLALREKFLGKRDSYVWFFGVLGTLSNLAGLFVGVVLLMEQPLVGGLTLFTSLLSISIFVAYLLLQPWARGGLFAVPVLSIVAGLVANPGAAAMEIGRSVLPFIFFLSAYRSPRNQLAFGMEVPREALQKMYRAHYDNQLARAGFILSLFSIVVPGLGILSGLLCGIGLSRVDPESSPPIGRKKTAVAGLILSGLGLLTTTAAIVLPWRG